MNILENQQKSRDLKGLSRLQWLEEEQKYLKMLYIDEGLKSWKNIASFMKDAFPSRIRTPKQYRQRFTNYIRFQGQKAERGSWTQEEDRIIFEKYMQLGSKWVEISKLTPGRSQNNVKNRFYSALRKMVRRINVVLSFKKKQHNIRKPIKQTAVFKLLQTQNITTQPKNQDFSDFKSRECFLLELKHDCLGIAMTLDGQIDNQKLFSIGTRLHKFNTMTRFQCLRKSRKTTNLKRRALPPIPSKKNQVKTQNMSDIFSKYTREEQLPDRSTKQPENVEKVIRNEFMRQDVEHNEQIVMEKNTETVSNDLEFQLCQILGIQYQPQQFYCI